MRLDDCTQGVLQNFEQHVILWAIQKEEHDDVRQNWRLFTP